MACAVTRTVGLGAAMVVAGLLAGCGGTKGFEADSSGGGMTLGNLLAFNSLKAPALPTSSADLEEKPTCPDTEVLDGTASSRVYAGATQSNSTVKYQFSLGDVVRECSHVGNQLVLKVGVEGRALLGPAGTPGGFAAPVRIAVRDEKSGKAVVSKLYQIPVTIAGGEDSAPFSIVSDPIGVPYVSSHADVDYTIVVGFDPKGDGNVPPQGKKRSRKQARS